MVKPIPDGYRTLTPHLIVKDAAKAIAFYKKAFGAQELFSMPSPDGKSIVHAELQFGDTRLMLCEECAEMGAKSPLTTGGTSSSIFVYVKDVDASFRRAIEAGAKELQPPTEMFWGDRYGRLQDPSGHEWEIATHVKDLTPEQIAKGAAEAFAAKA